MRSDIWNPGSIIAEQIIYDYSSGISARKLGFKYDVADVTITDFLKRNNVFIRNRSNAKRTNQIKEDIFDEINEESAYWIGFILADGNIYYPKNRSKQLNFGLKESDREHLEKFKKFVGSNKQLYYNNKAVFLSIYSNRIVDKIEEYGITQRKSLTAKVPEMLKNNRHFWRGVVDGDGWVTINKEGYPTIGLCGTIDVIKSFIELTGKRVKIGQPNLDKNFVQIAYTTTSAQILCKYLYDDSEIYLNRKYENYEKICLWKAEYVQNRSALCISN